MLSTLRELGQLSALYAEEEALLEKQPANQESVAKASTIVCAPVPVNAPKAGTSNNGSPVMSASVSSASLPSSPVLSHSSPGPNADCSLPAVVPFIAQRPSLPTVNKLPVGLSFVPISQLNSAVSFPQGILVQTPADLNQLSALPPTVLTTIPQYVTTHHIDTLSSLSSARLRKPFHKRRPAHMDKNMLFCHFCGRKETPEWRKGPAGPATLCNACGLQWAKKIRAQRNSAIVSVAESSNSLESKATVTKGNVSNKSSSVTAVPCTTTKKATEASEAN